MISDGPNLGGAIPHTIFAERRPGNQCKAYNGGLHP